MIPNDFDLLASRHRCKSQSSTSISANNDVLVPDDGDDGGDGNGD